MQKVIHQSWVAQADPLAIGGPVVALEFAGEFSEGSYAGERFLGHIRYDRRAAPSERHIGYAIYEDWPERVVTMAIGGQIVTGAGAAVYAGMFDGRDGHHDLVTFFGTCEFDGGEDNAHFELFFVDARKAVLDGTAMPTAAQLQNFSEATATFVTDAPGNVISRGAFTVIRQLAF